ncbi:hypothetical protein J7643_12755 [bacterium]|nr:hypothetical protein [bacterium]
MTEKLSKWLGLHLREVVIVGVVAGFAMVVIELLLMRHTEGKQLIALAGCTAGALFALLGLKAQGKLRAILAAGLLAVAFTGLLGVYFHLTHGEEEEEHAALTRLARWAEAQTIAHASEADAPKKDAEEGEEEHLPPLAPLSVSGLGMLGALGVLARRQG